MGACQSEAPPQQPQEPIIEFDKIDFNSMENIVLANWKHDQQDGSNKPNQIMFGKGNPQYDLSHDQFTQNQSQYMQSRITNNNNNTSYYNVTSQPINKATQSQRIQVFSGYSQVSQNVGLTNDQDIQRRPINLTRRNIF